MLRALLSLSGICNICPADSQRQNITFLVQPGGGNDIALVGVAGEGPEGCGAARGSHFGKRCRVALQLLGHPLIVRKTAQSLGPCIQAKMGSGSGKCPTDT